MLFFQGPVPLGFCYVINPLSFSEEQEGLAYFSALLQMMILKFKDIKALHGVVGSIMGGVGTRIRATNTSGGEGPSLYLGHVYSPR